MIRDPFFSDIIEALNGSLDPLKFELCAADLLSADFPSLVPIKGGSDGGQDGAIADGKGLAYPLITTTEDNVIRNVRKNLRSYLKKGGSRKDIVIATSRSLTPRRRDNLEKQAIRLGFLPIQIYDQEGIALRLYRRPDWCHSLLGLTGTPPPLSVFPLSRRFLMRESLLIGRDKDLHWIINTKGDLLLVGPPGSGKTFLNYFIAKQGMGLFVVSNDITEISNGIRSQRPLALIIDDAHLRLELIDRLKSLRTEMAADYRIIATCWPSQKQQTAKALLISEHSIRELGLLSRDDIVEVIKAAGITKPNDLVRELVNQSRGKPGLAVTLCYFCLKGGLRSVVLGDILSQDIKDSFEPLFGGKATYILAAIAIGGDSGMAIQAVADELSISIYELDNIVSNLAAGGVLDEVHDNRLSVQPPTLRYVLVRDIYLRGAISPPFDRLIEKAPSLADVVLTIIGAYARGGLISDDNLKNLIGRAKCSEVLSAYCRLGSDKCNWVINKYPDDFPLYNEAALSSVPHKAIPMIMNLAIGDNRQVSSSPDHPIRILEDWINNGVKWSGETISRRDILMSATLKWFSETENKSIPLKALKLVISPAFQTTELLPGSGSKVSLQTGYISLADLRKMKPFLVQTIDMLPYFPMKEWNPVLTTIREWAYPHLGEKKLGKDYIRLMKSYTVDMLTQLISASHSNAAIIRWSKEILVNLRIKPSFCIPLEFETVFPLRHRNLSERREVQQKKAAVSLARRWSKQDPSAIAIKIASFESSASEVNIVWPRLSPIIFQEIANLVSNPCCWIRALINASAPCDLIYSFLEKAVSAIDAETLCLLRDCLQKPSLRTVTLSILLRAEHMPDELTEYSFGLLTEEHYRMIEVMAVRKELSEKRVLRLLQHPNKMISAAAAIGEWVTAPAKVIRPSLREAFNNAIINNPEIVHRGGIILESEPDLCFAWLEKRISEDSVVIFQENKPVRKLIRALNTDQRSKLFAILTDNPKYRDISVAIVNEDLDIYMALLRKEHLRDFHLAPLESPPIGNWCSKARLALDNGYSAQAIAESSYGHDIFWRVRTSKQCTEWISYFNELLSNVDVRIVEIGKIGKAFCEKQRDQALVKEKKEAIYGDPIFM